MLARPYPAGRSLSGRVCARPYRSSPRLAQGALRARSKKRSWTFSMAKHGVANVRVVQTPDAVSEELVDLVDPSPQR